MITFNGNMYSHILKDLPRINTFVLLSTLIFLALSNVFYISSAYVGGAIVICFVVSIANLIRWLFVKTPKEQK